MGDSKTDRVDRVLFWLHKGEEEAVDFPCVLFEYNSSMLVGVPILEQEHFNTKLKEVCTTSGSKFVGHLSQPLNITEIDTYEIRMDRIEFIKTTKTMDKKGIGTRKPSICRFCTKYSQHLFQKCSLGGSRCDYKIIT